MSFQDRPDPVLVRYARFSPESGGEVLGIFYDRHSGWVRRYARRRLNHADASDVTEEAFLCLWRKLFHLRKPYHVKGFLARATRDKVCDCLRRNAKWRLCAPERLAGVCELEEGDLSGGLSRIPHLSIELWELVEHSLEPREHEIFLQRFYYGLTCSEISAKKELPEGSIRRVLHQARKKIRAFESFSERFRLFVR